ncbi:MAG: M23 family metallopeptidase [Bacteroidales bacterium]|nr:M23 family metallopeptidase [Candidatus Liminaster caballi]
MSEEEKKQPKKQRRYRLMLVSEREGRKVFSLSMPLWVTSAFFIVLAMLAALAIVLIIMKTPLKEYLPGYLDVTKRAVVVESVMRIDSLERENQLRIAYLDNLTSILRDRVKSDSIMAYDSAVTRIQDTLLTASEREAAFVAAYEERERFGLNALDAKDPAFASISFLSPVKGKIALPDEDDGMLSSVTRIELSKEVPVLAPLEGTVISIAYIIGQGYQLTLQHGGEYVSIFSHLSTVLVDAGQQVKTGKVIGHAGADKDPEQCWMGLQLWHKGKSVDPSAVMSIEN